MFGFLRRLVVVGAAGFFAVGARADLPGTYDLRTYGWITPTEDQGQLGSCWAFATTTIFQSSLLKNGVVTDPGSPDLALAIWHMATHNGNVTDLTYPYNGWGGAINSAVGYWTRGVGEWKAAGDTLSAGGGPVMEATNVLNRYPIEAFSAREDLSPYVPPTVQALAPYRLTESLLYRNPGTGAMDVEFRNTIKQAVLDHGAVAITMTAGGDTEDFGDYYNAAENTFRYTGVEGRNHAVAVAGWNDEKVVNIGGVESQGAWLVQNSWGEDFGEQGYFWIAYDDTRAGGLGLALDVRGAGNIGSMVLQNQIFAPETWDGGDAGEQTLAASRMFSQSDEVLMGLGLYMDGGQDFDLSIYDEWGAEGPVGDVLLTMDDLSVDQEGYFEFSLNMPLTLRGGDAVYVVVDFGDGMDAPVWIDSKSLTLEGVTSFEGLSWISDGEEWLDLADNGEKSGIFFMKGLVAVPEPSVVVLFVLGVSVAGWRHARKRMAA